MFESNTKKEKIKNKILSTIIVTILVIIPLIILNLFTEKDIKEQLVKPKKEQIISKEINTKKVKKEKQTKKMEVKEEFNLIITTKPEQAKIQIMNIKPKYNKKIKLKKGKYHIKISCNGYKTIEEWVEIKRQSIKKEYKLKKEKKINVNDLFKEVK